MLEAIEEPSPPDTPVERVVLQRWTSPDGICWPMTVAVWQSEAPLWAQVAQSHDEVCAVSWTAIVGREYKIIARGTGEGALNRGAWSEALVWTAGP